MQFVNQTFQDQDVFLDGNKFIGCTFNKCRITTACIMETTLEGNRFVDCTWGFVGPAANAVTFMAAIYSQGGDAQKIIEATFDNIRKGNPSAGGLVKH